MAANNILKYDDFKAVLDDLQSKNRVDNNSILTFVLYRYITKLGYDVYDLDVSVVDFEDYYVDISAYTGEASEPIHFIFSLLPSRDKFTSDDTVGFIYFDPSIRKLSLYFKVFDTWNLIAEVLFDDVTASDPESLEEQQLSMQNLNEFILFKSFNQNYELHGPKFFTGTVVDSMFVNGDLDNEFVRKSLIAELNDPSEALIKTLAKRLMNYSLRDEDWLYEQIKPLQEPRALLEVLNSAIKKSELKVATPLFATPTPIASKKRSPYEGLNKVDNHIEDKKDDLKNAGFGFTAVEEVLTTETADTEVGTFDNLASDDVEVANPFGFGPDDSDDTPVNLGDLFGG
jgi:hypothetical protein